MPERPQHRQQQQQQHQQQLQMPMQEHHPHQQQQLQQQQQQLQQMLQQQQQQRQHQQHQQQLPQLLQEHPQPQLQQLQQEQLQPIAPWRMQHLTQMLERAAELKAQIDIAARLQEQQRHTAAQLQQRQQHLLQQQDTLAQADLLVAPSRFMANWVQQHMPVQQPVLVQRNCPLSRGRITAGPEAQAARLVYFGRLEQRKGLLLFLEALEQLPKTPAEVVFVGGDCRIAEEHWGSELVQEQLERLGIRFRIETGLERDQALQRLRELAGVVVIPSLIENSPCVVEELLNSGLRLVTTEVGGTPELVSAASQPWLSAPEPAALASHLSKALQPVEPGAYQLQARLPGWQITLGWQAFHERLPRHQPKPTEAPASKQAPTNPVRRSLRLAKRIARKLMNLARNR